MTGRAAEQAIADEGRGTESESDRAADSALGLSHKRLNPWNLVFKMFC